MFQSIRRMKIHEFRRKALRRNTASRPEGEVVRPPPTPRVPNGSSGVVAVKAQIHAGGRGKGGGVKVAHTREDAEPPRRRFSACNW